MRERSRPSPDANLATQQRKLHANLCGPAYRAAEPGSLEAVRKGLEMSSLVEGMLRRLAGQTAVKYCAGGAKRMVEMIKGPMTFPEFQSTRRDATLEDLDRVSYTYTPKETPKAFIYIDELVIEDTSTWTNNPPKQYYLLIGNQQYFRDSLEPLERILYEYADSEGFFEEESQR